MAAGASDMKIAYVTLYDSADIHSWSGTGHYVAQALKDQGAELDYIGSLKEKVRVPLKLKLRSALYGMLRQRFTLDRSPYMAGQYARLAASLVRPDADVIFSPGSIPIALLDAGKPRVFYTDATFAGMLGFYDNYTSLCRETIANGMYLEGKALESATLVIYASDWAARSAIDNFNVDPEKVKVVPFGANLDSERDLETIKGLISRRSTKECHLLFMGVDWVRKRGDFAVKVASLLNQQGLKTMLHVAGIKGLPAGDLPDFVIDHGYISKSSPEGRNRIDRLMAQSHFLILPTRAEAYGLVLCEANSFGVPALATDVGGISTIIKSGVNGKSFRLSSTEEEYAEYIQSVYGDKRSYQQLACSSFNEYVQRLNWKTAGKAVMSLLREL